MEGTRKTDDPEVADRIRTARSEGRKRTIIYSVVAAGVVSLFIARASEVQVYNDQVNRSRTNCNLVQEDRKTIRDYYDSEADQVLGDPKEGIEPIKIENTAFSEFGPLILAQAKEDRVRAGVYAKRIEDCNKVFPKRKVISF
jgi:hypothetical protein